MQTVDALDGEFELMPSRAAVRSAVHEGVVNLEIPHAPQVCIGI